MPLMRVDPMGWIGEQVAVDPVPVQPYTPPTSGPTVIPRGKCILAFQCTSVVLGTHCGLSIKYWDDQTGSSVSKSLHAWGYLANGGVGNGCKIAEAAANDVSGYDTNSPVLVPQEACECILNNVAAYNRFMEGNDNYQLSPYEGDSCGSAPGCNSNFASACQLSKCGIQHKPIGVSVPGFNHRMKKCTSKHTGYYTDPKTGKDRTCWPRCICDKWEYIDEGVCGPGPQS
jgi:hypothetical protein